MTTEEPTPSFVEQLAAKSKSSFFDIKETTINDIIGNLQNIADARATEGYFDCTYTSGTLPNILSDHYEAIRDAVHNRLATLGFDNTQLIVQLKGGIVYKIHINCSWDLK